MTDYIAKIELHIEAENEEEAQEKFWEWINDTDYPIYVEITKE
jgi:hypothetical protein